MLKQKISSSLLIFFFVLSVYWIFSESEGIYSSYDSATFSIATNDYDLKKNLPHMPGYYLHIKLINAMEYVTGSVHSAMLWLNLLYSSFGAVFTYLIFRRYLNNANSILLASLIMTNPMTWYYGCSVGVYPYDLFYSTLIVVLCMNRRFFYFAPVVLTLGAGVRQSSGFFMLPVVIFFFIKYIRNKELKLIPAIISAMLSVVGFLLWAVPMLENAGGIDNYIALFHKNSPLSMRHAFIKNFTNAVTYGFYIFIPAILIIILSYLDNKKKTSLTEALSNEKKGIMLHLFLVWPLPVLIFFLLFVYSKGYYLINITGIFLIAAIFMKHNATRRHIPIIVIFIQIMFFIFMPFREPPLNVNMAPSKRGTSKIDAWAGRLCNVFLLSQKAIRSREDKARQIEEIMQEIPEGKDKIIFNDPSSDIKTRILQALYPQRKFAFMNVYESDSYFYLHYTHFKTKYDLKRIISKSVIISSREFYEKYLSELDNELIGYTSDFVAFRPKHASQKLVKLYNKYYLRED